MCRCQHSHVRAAGTGLAAPRSTASRGPGGLGTGSALRERLQRSLAEDLPAEMVPKSMAQGLMRTQEVRGCSGPDAGSAGGPRDVLPRS